MATPTTVDSVVTNPGGTGSNIVPTLSSHQAGDVIEIFVGKTGNVSWAAPAGWTIKHQSIIGTSSNGTVGTLLFRRVLSTDSLPLPSPTCSLGATVTRAAIALTKRGADIESVYNSPSWAATSTTTGTANPIRPLSVTTPAPEMLVHHYYCQRTATNAPEPTGYTQDQQIIISGTLVLNVSEKNVADQQTVLSSQDASPTSGARWVGMISCTPSDDYPYYRSGSQATVANGTSVDPALPAGTSSSNSYGIKDLVIANVSAAGDNINIQPNTPADWTEITGFATNTSGNGTTVRKYWALYDGSLDDVFTRPTNGELSVCLTTYYNVHQTTPIGAVNIRQNASSTTSTWDAVLRSATKCAMTATCVADGTPTFTVASGWIERMDGLGISCADQTFNAIGSTASASFTLSAGNPTAVGLVEIVGASSLIPITVIPGALALIITTLAPSLKLTVIPNVPGLTLSTFVPTVVQGATVVPSATSLTLSGFAPSIIKIVTPSAQAFSLTSFASSLSIETVPASQSLVLISLAPAVIKAATVIPPTALLTLLAFTPSTVEQVTPSIQALILSTFASLLNTEVTPETQSLSLTSLAPTISLTRLIDPTTGNLSLGLFVPNLLVQAAPSVVSISLTTFTPSIITSVTATPDPASLIITAPAPSLAYQTVPVPASLTISFFALVVGTAVIPASGSLALTLFNVSLRESVVTNASVLTLAAFSPSVQAAVAVIPSSAALTIATFVPTVSVTDQSTVIPATASLTIATLDPLIVNNVSLIVQPASLTVDLFDPRLDFQVATLMASLMLSGVAPSVLIGVIPLTTYLTLTVFAPAIVGADQDITVIPNTSGLTLVADMINLRQFIPRGINVGSERHQIDIPFESHAI